MKNVMQLLLSLAMVFALASCAQKKEESSSSSAAPVVAPIDDFYANATEGFGDYNALRSYFVNKGFDNGLAVGNVVYHVGPYYTGNNVNSGGSFNVGFCINFFGSTIGDCDNLNTNDAILQNILSNGHYKVVSSASGTGVSYDLATGIDNGNFVYEPRTFDDYTEVYRKMLNLDDTPMMRVLVSQAEIIIRNGANTQQTTTLRGDLIEYFVNQNTVYRYVVSQDLPKMANPIAIFEQQTVGMNTYAINPVGALNNFNSQLIVAVRATAHMLQTNFPTNETTVTELGSIGVTLN